jgi:DNA-binding transcriptional MocR family regulator
MPAMPLQVEPVRMLDAPNVVHVFSFSKVGLAAERVGVIAADPDIIPTLRRQLQSSAIVASYLGQLRAAALLDAAARTRAGSLLGGMYQSHWRTLRDALGPALADDPSVTVAQWQGGPFLWLSWQAGPDDTTVFRALLRHGVGVVPGGVLHAGGEPVRGVRIGLSAPPESLEEVGARVQASLRVARAGHGKQSQLTLDR